MSSGVVKIFNSFVRQEPLDDNQHLSTEPKAFEVEALNRPASEWVEGEFYSANIFFINNSSKASPSSDFFLSDFNNVK